MPTIYMMHKIYFLLIDRNINDNNIMIVYFFS